jgi:uncharacterized membrane protein
VVVSEQQQPVSAGAAGVVTGVMDKSPDDYLFCSIFNTFCCCLFLGIAALIYSIKTRQANEHGQRDHAQQFSKKAKRFNTIAFAVGLILLIFYSTFSYLQFR